MTREEAIKEIEILKEDYWDDDGYGHETKQYDDTMLALEMAIKALEQEPRKGHWIECMPGGAEEWCYKCSECNFWKYKKTINLSKFKYCPNCGADMRTSEE